MDAYLQGLKRHIPETDDPNEIAYYLSKLHRGGLLSSWRLRLAAVLGDKASGILYPDDFNNPLYSLSIYDMPAANTAHRWADILINPEDPLVSLASAALVFRQCAMGQVFYAEQRGPALELYRIIRSVCITELLPNTPFPNCNIGTNTYYGYMCHYLVNLFGDSNPGYFYVHENMEQSLLEFFSMAIDLGIHGGGLLEEMTDVLNTQLLPYVLGQTDMSLVLPD